jgi:Chloroplast envelope transporter
VICGVMCGVMCGVICGVISGVIRCVAGAGRMDAAASPASELQRLCEITRFSPEQAATLHNGLYAKKYR